MDCTAEITSSTPDPDYTGVGKRREEDLLLLPISVAANFELAFTIKRHNHDAERTQY